jgi:hypothetical protein
MRISVFIILILKNIFKSFATLVVKLIHFVIQLYF